MRLGGPLPREEMAAARDDPGVEEVARALMHAEQPRELLRYAMTAIAPTKSGRGAFAATFTEQLAPSDVGRLKQIQDVAARWQSLSAEELGRRKGAVVERLVELLLGRRLDQSAVRREERVCFDDGQCTTPVDVLGIADPQWEAIECKAGWRVDDDQGRELSFRARHAKMLGERLLAVFASAAERRTVLASLQRLEDHDLIAFVAEDSMFSLAQAAPSEFVPA